jgi:hypothetical protein
MYRRDSPYLFSRGPQVPVEKTNFPSQAFIWISANEFSILLCMQETWHPAIDLSELIFGCWWTERISRSLYINNHRCLPVSKRLLIKAMQTGKSSSSSTRSLVPVIKPKFKTDHAMHAAASCLLSTYVVCIPTMLADYIMATSMNRDFLFGNG